MRYFVYLIVHIHMQILAWILTPALPLFRVWRLGKSDNNRIENVEPRLPVWLSWFDTPDNSLLGDASWLDDHPQGTYWNMVAWLYRNSLYGFSWTVLSCPIDVNRTVTGNLDINYRTKCYGTFTILQGNGFWQWKCVKPFLGLVLILNLGWMLDDLTQEKALFMFSPRLKSAT